jgi:excinuclease ABC subunit A
VVLHGSGDEAIEFIYTAEASGAAGGRGKSRTVKRKHPFEGIIPSFERRFRDAMSASQHLQA